MVLKKDDSEGGKNSGLSENPNKSRGVETFKEKKTNIRKFNWAAKAILVLTPINLVFFLTMISIMHIKVEDAMIFSFPGVALTYGLMLFAEVNDGKK